MLSYSILDAGKMIGRFLLVAWQSAAGCMMIFLFMSGGSLFLAPLFWMILVFYFRKRPDYFFANRVAIGALAYAIAASIVYLFTFRSFGVFGEKGTMPPEFLFMSIIFGLPGFGISVLAAEFATSTERKNIQERNKNNVVSGTMKP